MGACRGSGLVMAQIWWIQAFYVNKFGGGDM